MTDWPLLLGTALFGAVAARLWHHWRPAKESPWASFRVDMFVVIALSVASYGYMRAILDAINPQWVPWGVDTQSYWLCFAALRDGTSEQFDPFRYPLYPALTVLWSAVTGAGLWHAGMEVSLLTSALVPVGVYLLGRTIASRPISLVGALLALRVSGESGVLGTPNPYPMAAFFYIVALAGLMVAMRDGGWKRHLLAGVALAGYAAVTSKAFPLVLLGVCGVVAAMVLGGDRRDGSKRAAFLAFFTPLVVCWVAFALADLPLYPLESLVYDVQAGLHLLDPARPFPDVGWGPENERLDQGYWVVGTLASITHIPQIIHYLAAAPVTALTLPERWQIFMPGGVDHLSLDALGWLIVASVFGTVGAWSGEAPWLKKLLVVGFGAVVTLVHLWGVSGVPYADRWATTVLASTPVLILAIVGAIARPVVVTASRELVVWAPMLVALGWVLGPSQGAFGRARTQWPIDAIGDTTPQALYAITYLQEAVRPGDALLDTSYTPVGRAVADGLPVVYQRATLVQLPNQQFEVIAPATTAPRRWIVLECVWEDNLFPDNAFLEIHYVMRHHPERYRRLSRCIYEDLVPLAPVESHLADGPTREQLDRYFKDGGGAP